MTIVQKTMASGWPISLFIAFNFGLVTTPLLATDKHSISLHPKIDLKFSVTLNDKLTSNSIDGEMTIRNWQPDSQRHCLYLPYNDARFEQDLIRGTDVIPHKYGNISAHQGKMSLSIAPNTGVIRTFSPHIIEILDLKPNEDLKINFTSQAPRWSDSNPNEWMFHQFYPQILGRCPGTDADVRQITIVPEAEIHALFSHPSDWDLSAAANHLQHIKDDVRDLEAFEMTARQFSFAMHRKMTTQIDSWNGLTVEWVSHSDDFLKFKPALYNALATHSEIFGPFPFPKLVVLETSELHKASIPGIITINRPQQTELAHIQDNSSNWTDWQVTAFSADQWVGAGLSVYGWNELWLLRGLIEFATIDALRNQPGLFGLMKHPVDPELQKPHDQLNFDYRQSQDLLAAGLTFMEPYNALTDGNFHNLDPIDRQYGLNYIRAALSLRQLNHSLGKTKFRSITRSMFTKFHHAILTAESFAEFLTTENVVLTADEKRQVFLALKRWWSTNDWPDFVLDKIEESESSDHHFVATVHFTQREGYSLPVTVRVVDDSGKSYTSNAIQDQGDPKKWSANFDLSAHYDVVEVEPTRQIFDWNRFNNTNKWPHVHFLPGNMKTFADDAYSVIWLPLASKLPGDDFTWLFVAQVFRYIQASVTAVVSYVPNTKRYGYSLYYLTDYPKIGSYTIFDVIQDRGKPYSGERVADAAIYRTFSLLKNPVIEYGLRLRHREAINQPQETGHETLAFKAQAVPINQHGACNYNGRTELERMVHTQVSDEGYQRTLGMIEGSCKSTEWLEVGARGFRGMLNRETSLSENLDFNPQDINEARLRIDNPQLADVREISTVGLDLLTPMPLPLPSALFTVNRQMRFRMFYDYGESHLPENRYRDAGIGLWVPFGGDLVGKGSVQILNLSILAVLYRETNEYKSLKPGLVFDFDFFGKI